MKAILFAGILLSLCASGTKADPVPPQVGPTWNILAGGVFSGYPGSPGAESFSFDLTLTFEEEEDLPGVFNPTAYLPTWSGTASFAGILGNFT
jgi:hypothetical protein